MNPDGWEDTRCSGRVNRRADTRTVAVGPQIPPTAHALSLVCVDVILGPEVVGRSTGTVSAVRVITASGQVTGDRAHGALFLDGRQAVGAERASQPNVTVVYVVITPDGALALRE